jgi:hypothetical protein
VVLGAERGFNRYVSVFNMGFTRRIYDESGYVQEEQRNLVIEGGLIGILV